MAIPSRQIGGSTTTNLLWQISKQLEELICVRSGGCNNTTTTTTTCINFINRIVISDGSYANTNGTYVRDNPLGAFTQIGGIGTIFFGGDAWYIFYSTLGNVAKNTSELGTGTWEPWPPGNSSGIVATYYYDCFTTTNYNVAGCERMEYHVITYNGEDVLPEGTIVNNDTPECWFIVDQTTNPADVGTITYVWPTLNECQPCIDSHTTTTTTTTAALVNSTNAFVDCPAPCNEICSGPFNYFDIWMTQECLDTFPTIGCAIWLNIEGTVAFPDGTYNNGNAICIVITDGIITNII